VIDADLYAHYADRYDEAGRLSSTLRGRLERTRVRELLARHLPASPAEVADIGGGPGVHAAWLRTRGYRVRLLDAVPRHVDAARAAGLSAVVGDARELPWPDGSLDAAFLAGPLYHLVDPDDRIRALGEARRVVRPGGPVAVIALSRHANLIGATLAGQLEQRRPIVEDIEVSGTSRRNDRMAPSTYYHSVTELRGELTAVGLRDVAVHGVTGPGGWLAVVVDRHFDGGCPPTMTGGDSLRTAVQAARMADRHSDLVAASALLMAVARTPRAPR
jgi:ubiquinone/menaquinone biosynthesis C-methylase UbiE